MLLWQGARLANAAAHGGMSLSPSRNVMLKKTLALLFVIALSTAALAGPSESLEKLLDDVWQWRMQEWPQYATRTGDHRYNDRLGKVSLADADRAAKQDAEFLEQLRAIDRDALSKELRLERDLLERELTDSLADYAAGQHLLPINNRSGFHIQFPELPDWSPFDTVKDYENYIARLRAFAAYTDGHIELMREGVQRGLTVPAIIMEGYESSIDSHVVDDPTESLLYKPFKKFAVGVPESEHERLRREAREAIAQSVVPAYRRFGVFMADEYVPNCRSSIGASALPGGRDFYRHCVRKFTTLDMTPEEVHRVGLAEVARIRREMEDIIDRSGFETDEEDRFAAFVEHLRTSPQFYAETDTELMAYTAAILKRIDGELPSLFGRLPRMPYGLKPVPDYIAPKTTFAYYQSPQGDGTVAGFFFLNTYDLKARPKYMIEALSMHEAVPGHHLQIALQQELDGLSPLRKYGGFTAFVEGWALYAERLGLEAGFYEDPYSDFGRLTMEIWRAARLVVDTGMHYKGWSRQQAIDYMADNSAMSLHEIRSEVDRYIGWPGQALAYKTGELKIRELRELAEEKLGDRFDVRAFHDAVLVNGAVPLVTLEELIREWIDEQAAL
ncbi:DUF885 domain-containing protein [Botrimarina mediterranea]|uniref:DUF885 domain-containing protein n=1 Tax=Botrimarina mediterranea TaxID=2528022 RepID=A0A518KCM9_9BACT|nr:DUF885 domain-containing protein [Botrimarina mediterranea]QDV75538.1 hypothetical protein Spa11_37560 [Botrimarina mediterranea]QDV80172.1 hypothetical protein K2D_37960 [Planctomycetes bacterium K2D]